ncbi:MAG: MFS transporter [Rhodospirillales bacterium]|nr:MAG: MFS transporter [Rhodospirillales bacterium]
MLRFATNPEAGGWRRPEILLLLMAAAAPISFSVWMALLNNFSVEHAAFTGAEIGILQSLREIPGFLSFAVVFLILIWREQTLAYLSLVVLGLGTALTGYFPSVLGLYVTTVLMSIGFHYYETVQVSVSLQWIDKSRTPEVLGRIIAAGSFASIATFVLIWLAFDVAGLDYHWVYLIGGGLTAGIAAACWIAFPRFPEKVRQHRHMVLRRRYWLYYLLTFMSGARRQIFVVFASFLMVEKFGYSVGAITLLFLLNSVINVIAAPRIGRLIGRIGERRALIFEYAGLVGVFTLYAVVDDPWMAAGLYVVDHLFFALAIAMKTYFQKIADPADIAATAGVGYTINHISSVAIPVVFGLIWLASPAAVFLAGALMAMVSLLLSMNVPAAPEPGNEVLVGRRLSGPVPAPLSAVE